MVDDAPRAEMMMGGVPFLPAPSLSFKNSGKDEEEEEEEGVVSLSGTAALHGSLGSTGGGGGDWGHHHRSGHRSTGMTMWEREGRTH